MPNMFVTANASVSGIETNARKIVFNAGVQKFFSRVAGHPKNVQYPTEKYLNTILTGKYKKKSVNKQIMPYEGYDFGKATLSQFLIFPLQWR